MMLVIIALLGDEMSIMAHLLEDEALALLDTLLQNAPVGMAFIDREFRYVRINAALAALNGQPVEEHLGRTVREILPNLAPAVEPIFQRVLATGEPIVDIEVLEQRSSASDQPRYWQGSYYPVRRSNGEIAGIGIVAADITERHFAQEALQQSEERYRSLVTATTSLVWVCDAEGAFVSPQADWEAYTGQPWAEHQGWGWMAMIHPDDRAMLYASWRMALAAKTVYEARGRVWHAASASYHHFVARAAPVRNSDDTLREWIGTMIDIHERVRAEEALSAREMWMAVAVEAGRLGTWQCDLLTGTIESSALCKAHFGLPSEAILTFPVLIATIHPSDRAAVSIAIDEAIEQSTDFDTECRVYWPDGSIHWLMMRGIGIIGAAGLTTWLVGVTLDITANRRAALAQHVLARMSSELVVSLDYAEVLARLARLAVPDLADYCLIDVVADDGSIRHAASAHADPAKAELLDTLQHYPFDPAYERDITQVISSGAPIFLPTITADWIAASAHNTDHAQVLYALAPQSAIIVPLQARHSIIGALSLVTSNSERRYTPDDLTIAQEFATRAALAIDNAQLYAAERSARALAEAAERRAALLAEASEVLATNIDYEVTLQRVADIVVARFADLCVIFVAAANGMIYRVASAHVDPVQAEQLRSLMQYGPIDPESQHPAAQVMRSGQSLLNPLIPLAVVSAMTSSETDQRNAYALIPRTHLVVPLSTRQQVIGAISFGMHDAQRSFSAADCALAEELARRVALAIDNARLYRAAQEAVRLRDSFFSVAAHELKTPLTVLLGQAQLLERRAARDSQLSSRDQRAISIIASQVLNINQMINELLDVAHMEQGQFRIEYTPLDIKLLVQRVVDEIQPTLSQHGLVFETGVESLMVAGDGLRLRQVFHNLIQNAIKYSPNGGTVTVRLERNDPWGYLHVIDQGIGIPRDALPRLFQRFYRAANADAHQFRGMGVGLYVVKEIITLHGGTVEVASTEGVGSTFTVRLPILEHANQHTMYTTVST